VSTPVVEVVEAQVSGLQLGAHHAVADHRALRQSVEDVPVVAVFVSDSHTIRIVRLCKVPGKAPSGRQIATTAPRTSGQKAVR
jgi:hypothetical protein